MSMTEERTIAHMHTRTRRKGRTRLLPALLLLAAGCTNTLHVKHDAAPDMPQAAQPDVAEAPADEPVGGDDAQARDVLGIADAASSDVRAIADGARADATVSDAPGDPGMDPDATASRPDAPSPADVPGTLPDTRPMVFDVAQSDLTDVAPAAPATLCEQTGGTVSTIICQCPDSDFYDTCQYRAGFYCQAGSCTIGSYPVKTCSCPGGSCFMVGNGCVSIVGCTVGMDQTCNDNPALPASHGKCIEGGYCLCTSFNPDTGKCL
jgi:hypothetical protein